VFRLEVDYFGEEEGGHGRATRHWGAVLEGWLENARNQGWHGRAREHGVAVPSCCPGRFVIARFLPVCVVFVFCFWDVFGWVVGHLRTLALIPNDV